jgi:biotin carboxylase
MECIGDLAEAYAFPLIIKERKSYTGMGVRIVHNVDELKRHVTRNFEKGLFAEPFLPGSEVSMEVIAWKGEMYFQPMVYKGETRQNIVEHPAYRPRISPFKHGTPLEEKVISIVGDAVEKLQLQGAAEFEFIITDGEPYVMEINPRISGITRLCKAAGGLNVYRLLTRAAMTGRLGEGRGNGVWKYALQLPLTVLPEGEFLERLRRDPHISYIKPITWMPLLPIKSNIIMSYDTIDELRAGMMQYAAFTHSGYLCEAEKAFGQF